jgi:hypothetical protein
MSRTFSHLFTHIVFSTKGRAPLIVPDLKPELHAYIRNQEEHHQKFNYQEEFLSLLRKHGVEYDERYVWD